MHLLVVQPHIPDYRVQFFNQVSTGLASHGVSLTIAASRPGTEASARKDAGTADSLEVSLLTTRTRALHVGGARVRWQGTWKLARQFDAVIYEATAGLLDATLSVALGQRRLGLWGHIDAFVKDANRLDTAVERLMLRRAGVVLAYTGRGARVAIEAGCDQGKVFTLNNTVPTDELANCLARTTYSQANERLNLTSLRQETFCFIGGIDSSKRINFLVDVLDRLWATRPRFHLVVAGAGEQLPLLDAARSRGQVTVIGRIGDQGKADLARLCAAIVMPGRVGLVAVESFVLGLPIITTAWPYHAPEFDYLRPGHDSIVSADSPEAYAATIEALVDQPEHLAALAREAWRRSGEPSINEMVRTFCDGALQLLSGR